MSAFDDFMRPRYAGAEDNTSYVTRGEHAIAEAAWSAALKHAAEVCVRHRPESLSLTYAWVAKDCGDRILKELEK